MELGDISGVVSRGKRSSQGSKSLSFAQRGSMGKLMWGKGKKKRQAAAPPAPPESVKTADSLAGNPEDQAADMMAEMMDGGDKPALGGGDFGKLSSGSGGST